MTVSIRVSMACLSLLFPYTHPMYWSTPHLLFIFTLWGTTLKLYKLYSISMHVKCMCLQKPTMYVHAMDALIRTEIRAHLYVPQTFAAPNATNSRLSDHLLMYGKCCCLHIDSTSTVKSFYENLLCN